MNWSPFVLVPATQHAPAPRDLSTKEGVCDRLRAAAFAEIQAREGFRWAAERFLDAPINLKDHWLFLANEEDKHLGWLLDRLHELGEKPGTRGVSDRLWQSFLKCQTAQAFAIYMATAEKRGQKAGERFARELSKSDPVSGELFRKIAEEEESHIKLVARFFPHAALTTTSPNSQNLLLHESSHLNDR